MVTLSFKNRSILKTSINILITGILMIAMSCAPAKQQTYLYELNARILAGGGSSPSFIENREEYKLQPGDIVSIRITSLTPSQFNFFEQEGKNNNNDPIASGYVIDSEGYIVLPYIGNLKIIGFTVRETQDKIAEVVSNYLDSPNVYVRFVSFHFTVLGEVDRQGKYLIVEDRINVLEALGVAGGLTEYANFEKLRILRTTNGVSKMGVINLLADNLPSSDYYYLHPNDVIIVDQLNTKNFRRNSSGNIGLILSGIATIATVVIAYDRLGQ